MHLDAQVAAVALGPGDMPAGPDQSGQVGAPLDTPVVHRGTGVPEQQRARVTIENRLLYLLIVVGEAIRLESDVAVRVDQSGQRPATGADRLGTRDRLEADPVADDPGIAL